MTEILKNTVQISWISLGADHASCIMAKRRICVACKMSSYRKGLDTTWCVKARISFAAWTVLLYTGNKLFQKVPK
uniref:Uncharacterized protein n=1 Tax=Anopheles quadriannulatus TaxID=34691 RepID=A0A182XQJ5_ANOQN